ncbi:hypothetical protein WMF30_34815 [Sorangium sp. So ce134]
MTMEAASNRQGVVQYGKVRGDEWNGTARAGPSRFIIDVPRRTQDRAARMNVAEGAHPSENLPVFG